MRSEASSFAYKPLVSILMPVLGTELLERALDSVLGQVYPDWELRICCNDSAGEQTKKILSGYERLDGRVKVQYGERAIDIAGLANAALSSASGEFACILYAGDEMAPDALFEVVKTLQEHGDSDLVYSDEDRIGERGNRSNPHFKPDWSPDLLLSTNYISHLSVYRKSLLEEVGGFREDFEGCHDYDLVLRVTERSGEIRHVAKVLYHRGANVNESRDAKEKTRRALSETLERRGLEGAVEDGLLADRFRVRLHIKDEPKVSLIIPTRDNVSLLKNCVESIERLTTYRNYEILIVDNDSADPKTVEYLASAPHRVLRFEEEFNYSRINNFAVSQANGEYVLLLNDDTEVISGEWLEAMLEHAQRPEVGAVGARLLYPDGRVQHAGVLLGIGNPWGPGVALHSHQFYPSSSAGYAGIAMTTANYSAVTAACVLLRRSLFEDLGGFDEENLRVSFNDVDLCLRIRERGYLITYTPHAELYHHESVSRGYSGGNPAETLYMRNRWGKVMDEDPYYNANFSRGSGDFNLRADLLRSRTLRQEAGKGSANSFENPLTASREGLTEYIKTQQKAARSSHRNSILPTLEDSNGRSRLLEFLEEYEAPETRENGATRPLVRAAKGQGETLRTNQLIWMFGSPRTGSTWLSRMMAELENQERWHEPYIGLLFGSFLYERLEGNEELLNSSTFIMGEPYRDVWLGSVRHFLLAGAAARYPRLREDQYLVVKEPNGSVGAPLLMEATPESRMIFLIRDSRDVVASRLDAFKEGAWSAQKRYYDSTEKLNAFTRHLAKEYSMVVSQVERAYEAHRGKKTLVRYEDLRDDTVTTLGVMYAALEIEVDEVRLEAAVAKHSWEQIPDSQKGEGKFYRKAEPGSWRSDLSTDQIEIVEEVTGPILSRYYRTGVGDQTFSG